MSLQASWRPDTQTLHQAGRQEAEPRLLPTLPCMPAAAEIEEPSAICTRGRPQHRTFPSKDPCRKGALRLCSEVSHWLVSINGSHACEGWWSSGPLLQGEPAYPQLSVTHVPPMQWVHKPPKEQLKNWLQVLLLFCMSCFAIDVRGFEVTSPEEFSGPGASEEPRWWFQKLYKLFFNEVVSGSFWMEACYLQNLFHIWILRSQQHPSLPIG